MGFQFHLLESREPVELRLKTVKLRGRVRERSGLVETGVPIGLDHAQFTRFCRNAYERLGADATTETPGPPDVAQELRKAKRPPRRAAGAREAVMKVRRKSSAEFRDWFVNQFIKEVNPRRVIRRATRLILPGDIRVKTVSSKLESTLRARTKSGKDVSIACLQYKPSLDSMTVLLSVTVRRFASVVSGSTFSRLQPAASSVHPYRLSIRGARTTELSLVAESLARLINRGIIDLPDVNIRADGDTRGRY
jgi:hypothetical protein